MNMLFPGRLQEPLAQGGELVLTCLPFAPICLVLRKDCYTQAGAACVDVGTLSQEVLQGTARVVPWDPRTIHVQVEGGPGHPGHWAVWSCPGEASPDGLGPPLGHSPAQCV